MTFGEPVQLQPSPAASDVPPQPGITFGEPIQLAAPPIKFGAPQKAVSFGSPVDIFSDDAPIGLFEKWKAEQPQTSLADDVGNAAGHFLSGAGQAIKTIFERTLSTVRGITDPSLNIDEKYDRVATKNIALGAEVGSEAFKGFAGLGEGIKSFLAHGQAPSPTPLADAVNNPKLTAQQHEEARTNGLVAERKFYRTMRDLQSTSNDGRLIVNALTSTLTGDQHNEIANTPVNMEAAQFLSNFVDPDAAGAVIKASVRGIGLDLAKAAVKQLPYTGELAALEKQVAEAQAKVFSTETEVLAAKSAGADAAVLEKALKSDTSALAEANQLFKSKIEFYDAQAVANGLESQTGKGYLQKGAGRVVEAGGKLAQGAGEIVGSVNSKLDEILSHFSQGSAAGEKVVDSAAGRIIPGNSIRYALEGALKSGGRDVAEAGRLISATESSLPYFQSLTRALPEGSLGRWASSQAERFDFLADTGRWAFDTAEAGARGAAAGAAFGSLNGDPVGGAVQGVFFGMAGQQYGQFAKMNSKADVFIRQQTDIALSRKRAEGRGPEALLAFDKLSQGNQLLVATLEQSHPDMYVNLSGKNGVSWYDYNGSVGEVGIDPKHPLSGALTHEVKHHLGRNPEIAQAVETKILGDPDSGVAGLFTARDAEGKPIVIETPDAQNPENIRREFQLSPEFFDLREQYLQRLRDAGLPTIDYEKSNRLIAHEIWAESQTANLLNRRENGEFDIVGLQRMGPTQRKIADLFADSDLVANSAFLQKALGKMGIVFDGLSGRAANTDLFHRSIELPGMEKLLREYYRKSDQERTVATDPESFGVKHYTEAEILSSPALTELFNSGHDVVRDPVSGKVHFITEKEAQARAKDFHETLTSELDQYAGNEPGAVKKVKTVDANGRESEVYMGKKIPESVVAKMEATGRFNESQLANLRNLGKLITESQGNEVNFFYQPAMKRSGKLYRTRPVTERTETPMTIRITKDANVVINTISQEKLMRNAVDAVKSRTAELWGNDFQKLWADVQVYLDNHAQGLAGDANGLGVDKKNFINSLFGQFTKEQREFNPFLQDISERKARNAGIVQSRRLDRINKMFALDSTFKPDYAKVARNYSPGAKIEETNAPAARPNFLDHPVELPPKEKKTGTYKPVEENPKFKRWFGKSKVVDSDGNPLVVHHGTPNDFTVFKREAANPESDLGAGFYFSNTPDDVSSNYAGLGPDLTSKIERRAEQLESNDNIPADEALKRAKAEMMQHQGATMPVYLRLKEPAIIGGPKETFLDAEADFENDKFDGKFAKFIDGLKEHAGEFSDTDGVDETASRLMEKFGYDGGGKLSDVWEAAKTDPGISYATNERGDLAVTELLRQALESAGFDGIIDHTVDSKFGSQRRIGKQMKGMDEDTVHYVAFHPEQIKSAIGNRGTFDPKNPDIRFSPGAKEKADEPMRISTRVPTAKASTENPLESQLSITGKDVVPTAEAAQGVAAILQKYPNVPADLKKPADVLAAFKEHVVSNLLYLHDQFDPVLRERAKLWYDGARKLTERWSESYDLPREGVAGILASLSPQKDWFMNVDLARRVIEHNQALKKRSLSDGMVDWFRGKFGEKKPEVLSALESKVGQSFNDLGLLERAIVLRAFDEMSHDRGYQIITPEGDFSGPARNADGKPSKVAWGDFNTIAKALSIADNPTRENISKQLGEEHKVRNFANNILLPNMAEHGDVTIDTHAVAAALLRPLSGSSVEVAHNFGSGAPSSSITGASGLYGLYADAYREAAAQRDRLPREMQSITWEAVRGLFPAEFKTAKNQEAVDSIWKSYKSGTTSLDDARKQIFDLAGGITAPSWSGRSD